MRMRNAVIVTLWLMLTCSQDHFAESQAATDPEHATLIGAFQQNMPGFAFSADGAHSIVGFEKGGVMHYEVDGKAGGDYTDCTRPVFGPDSGHWAYAGKKDGKWWIVTDQAEYGPYEGVGGCTAPCRLMQGGGLTFALALICTFSDDGKHFAYAASQGGQWVIMLDGKSQGTFDSIGINSLRFDSTGTRFAFWGKREGKWFLVLDGQPRLPASDDLTADWCVFTSQGKRAFWAVKEGTTMTLASDGERVASGQAVGRPVCSVEGPLWLATVSRFGKSYVLTDGHESPAYDKIVDGPVLSPDGQHYAFAAKKGESFCVVRDGKEETPPFTDIARLSDEGSFMGESPAVLRFSPDSRTLALAAKGVDGNAYVVANDRTYGPYENVATIGFGPDGKRLMFVVRRGKTQEGGEKSMVVLDGTEARWFDQVEFTRLSVDGKHYAYAAKNAGEWQILLDGALLENKYKDVESLLFEPGGQLIFVEKLASGKSVLQVGAERGKEWDIMSRIDAENISEGDKLTYLCVAGGKLHRATWSLSSARGNR